jgi:hypothetical protein
VLGKVLVKCFGAGKGNIPLWSDIKFKEEGA